MLASAWLGSLEKTPPGKVRNFSTFSLHVRRFSVVRSGLYAVPSRQPTGPRLSLLGASVLAGLRAADPLDALLQHRQGGAEWFLPAAFSWTGTCLAA